MIIATIQSYIDWALVGVHVALAWFVTWTASVVYGCDGLYDTCSISWLANHSETAISAQYCLVIVCTVSCIGINDLVAGSCG